MRNNARVFLMGMSMATMSSVIVAQSIFPTPLSPRIANYSIDVSLDTKAKTLEGKETVVWKNTSKDDVSELQFHLYLNAFRNSQSTFMKESGGSNRGFSIESDGWGWTDVATMQLTDGTDLLAGSSFIHPDDDNNQDRTVLSVPLPKPVKPGQSIEVAITFKAKLPTVFARTGYKGEYYFVGQWFPKLGVYEPAGMRGRATGGWNCHQFHSNTEFYADYGVYDVFMTIPKGYVLGATGILQNIRQNPNGSLTYSHHAEDVHDFAFTCSPDYKVFEETWKHVKIRLLLQPEHVATSKDAYFESVKGALQYFDEWVGKYPYPNLTVVDPPMYASGAGGMEYPTLITGGAISFLPAGLRMTELVTVHEFGHQYWYGLVGNNEFEEAWMDEGFNQYSETRIMDHLYGSGKSMINVGGYKIGDSEFARSGYLGMSNPKIAQIDTLAWSYRGGGYSSLTYSKTAAWLITLERLIGRPVFDEAMRTYFQRWQFRHPARADFQEVFDEVVQARLGNKFGPSLDWFFAQMLDGTEVCDYSLSYLDVRQVSKPRGHGIDSARKDEKKPLQETTVMVSRLGEVVMPVTIQVMFDDGSMEKDEWSGKERYKRYTFVGPRKAVKAVVDPDRVLWIDKNFANNERVMETKRGAIWKYTFKFLFWLENIVSYSAIL